MGSDSPTYVLTVNSSNPASGVAIGAAPHDTTGATTGSTGAALLYELGTTVKLTAPASASGNAFASWTGCTTTSALTCTVVMNANATVTANYATPTTYTLTVNSTNPASGVPISATPADNLWYREGEMLYPPSASPAPYVLEPTLIAPEGNPQILTHNSTVWKMWYSSAYPGIFYAESLDGIHWSKYGATPTNNDGTPVVKDCLRSFVIESTGTYHLYCAANHGNGNSIDEFTSTDGVHFTLAYADVIKDGMGSWNTGQNDNSSGVVLNGVLYLFVEESGIGIALFTSTDFHTFTPVSLAIPTGGDTQGPSIPYLINGAWYMWLGHTMIDIPGTYEWGIQRWSAPAITGPWTNSESGFEFLPQTPDEGAGTLYAEALDPALLEVNGKTYLYYSANRGTPQNMQQSQIVKLAVADMPLSDLVTRSAGMSVDGTIHGATGFALTYNAGTSVTLTAPATSGSSTFTSWTGCTAVAANVCTVAVSGNTTVTANYN